MEDKLLPIQQASSHSSHCAKKQTAILIKAQFTVKLFPELTPLFRRAVRISVFITVVILKQFLKILFVHQCFACMKSAQWSDWKGYSIYRSQKPGQFTLMYCL